MPRHVGVFLCLEILLPLNRQYLCPTGFVAPNIELELPPALADSSPEVVVVDGSKPSTHLLGLSPRTSDASQSPGSGSGPSAADLRAMPNAGRAVSGSGLPGAQLPQVQGGSPNSEAIRPAAASPTATADAVALDVDTSPEIQPQPGPGNSP